MAMEGLQKTHHRRSGVKLWCKLIHIELVKVRFPVQNPWRWAFLNANKDINLGTLSGILHSAHI